MSTASALFEPVKPARVFEEVAARIKELIFDGQLKPGDRLPAESALAKQFGVGRQTIREALRLLERSGFITIAKGGGGGSTIADAVTHRLKDLLVDSFRLHRVEVQDLTTARLAIEKVIFETLLDKIDPAALERLTRNVWAARKELAGGRQSTPANIEFHLLAAQATQNHVFLIVEQAIMAVLSDFLTRSEIGVEDSRATVDCHEELVKALAGRDRDALSYWLYKDLSHANDLFQRSLGQAGQAGAPDHPSPRS